jgi:tetratricopeptide (TPR) repeat protein
MQRNQPSRIVAVLLSVFLLSSVAANAQTADRASFDADLQRAMQLLQTNRMPEAIPILESLNSSNPNHVLVSVSLAYALLSTAATDKDMERRKSAMIRARQLAEKAQKLGDNSQLLQMLLRSIPPDGEMAGAEALTKSKPASEALTEGEAAFSRGELEAAIGHYERAFKLDPALYEAPLFIGDAYFKMGKIDEAGANYAKAIALDPDRDTAYRFWGDALVRAGKLKEAREQFVEGIIAEPYVRETWQFLSNWAQLAKVALSHPGLDLPSATAAPRNSDVWTSYTETKARWTADDKAFKEAYPAEPRYRHSMKEEVSALLSVVGNVEARLKDGRLNEQTLSLGTANLMALHKAGLLESYVLLAMADEGISRDYPEYRKQNREKLRQYLNDFVTRGNPGE